MIMLKVLRWTMFLIGMRLELDNNFFDGTIPASIGGLRNLTSLSLRGNQLTREIPVEPFNCIGLVSLDLGSNSLTGHVCSIIWYYPGITSLVSFLKRYALGFKRHHCQILNSLSIMVCSISPTSLWAQFLHQLASVFVIKELLLNNNELNGSIPSELSGLSNLSLLNLSSNHLTGPAVPIIFTLKNLQGLLLSHNELTGSIPDNIASLMPSLIELDMSWNFLSGSLP